MVKKHQFELDRIEQFNSRNDIIHCYEIEQMKTISQY